MLPIAYRVWVSMLKTEDVPQVCNKSVEENSNKRSIAIGDSLLMSEYDNFKCQGSGLWYKFR